MLSPSLTPFPSRLVDREVIALDDVEAALRTHYGVDDAAPQQLANSWGGQVFRQPRPRSPGWVVRVLDGRRATGDARVLSFLEAAQYPAPRLVRSLYGSATVPCGTQAMMVTTFIEGISADSSLLALYCLGRRLGQLHALDLPTSHELPRVSMLPSTDMATALDWLRSVSLSASPGLAETYDRLVSAIQGIASSNHLPHTLIHNDAHPGNATVTATGDALFIDWLARYSLRGVGPVPP